jgi:hypothetical protein
MILIGQEVRQLFSVPLCVSAISLSSHFVCAIFSSAVSEAISRQLYSSCSEDRSRQKEPVLHFASSVARTFTNVTATVPKFKPVSSGETDTRMYEV